MTTTLHTAPRMPGLPDPVAANPETLKQFAVAARSSVTALRTFARGMGKLARAWRTNVDALARIQFRMYPRGTRQHRNAARYLYESPQRSVPIKANARRHRRNNGGSR